ncbi:MAG: hypothetical protein ACXWYJ_07730 [Actinomycetota bacterium]|jgi:hypothetical protein
MTDGRERTEPKVTTPTWSDLSPLAQITEPVTAPGTLAEGPVRFLIVSGQLDDGRWGLVGSYWLSIDGQRGGFVVAPDAIWSGSEIVRSYKRAVERGWDHELIYAYWQRQVGLAGLVMIDPQQHADTLFQVARRVGAL